MKKELILLDKLDAEHKELMREAHNIEHIANDLDAGMSLKKASEDFVPWRIDRCKQIVRDLQVSLEMIDTKLSEHFDREEKDLLVLCQTHDNGTFGSVLLNLIFEHGEIRNRIAKSKLDVASLANDDLSPYIWESRAYPVRFYLNHTRRRLQAHAEGEQELLNALRRELEGQPE
jgi:hypothetical protein